LGYRIQVVGEGLPVGQVAAAADRLRSAHQLLAWVSQSSNTLTLTPALIAAGDRLDHAAGAMLAAREALAAYLVSIGLPRESVPPPDREWRAALTVSTRPPRPRDEPPPVLTDFWADRVDLLTGESGVRPEGTVSTPELLHRCARAVLAQDRRRLRRELVAAGPAVGLGLAAVAPAVIRHLVATLTGHAPQEPDLPLVRRTVVPRLRPLLPKLPAPETVDELLARACHAPPPDHHRPATHPVDSAVTAAVLVGVLLEATGQDAEELSRITQERERVDEESE
jgi:hypothetical protein